MVALLGVGFVANLTVTPVADKYVDDAAVEKAEREREKGAVG